MNITKMYTLCLNMKSRTYHKLEPDKSKQKKIKLNQRLSKMLNTILV